MASPLDAALAAALSSARRVRDPQRRLAAVRVLLETVRRAEAAATAVRDEAVLQLKADGCSYRVIARLAGTTPGRVHQIVSSAAQAEGRTGA